ncbi:MAG TPA: methylated-DNA--[protein]-cysteine S-methyltransferase [Puia sp.]|nr:methylated-DNA--[protein]-cysteine S-methyltransferase [Puia sp.]
MYVQMKNDYVSKTMDSPVGRLTLIANQKRKLTAIQWEKDDQDCVRPDHVTEDNDDQVLLNTEQQLSEYFRGERQIFSLDLDFDGTEFQNKVWNALLTIPFGETRSYGDIARQIGNPKSVRAVGAANGKNPIPIVVPCHRVIGSSGKLVGFGGGMGNKALLLNLEKAKTGKQKQISLF